MKCPNCQTNLSSSEYLSIPIETCSNCGGMWFEKSELDQVEDTIFDQDELKNSLLTHVKHSSKQCPVCENALNEFKYRWEELLLDYCPQDHGYWLDKGEIEKVLIYIQNFKDDLDRKLKAEEEWEEKLNYFRSPSLTNLLKSLF